MKRTMVSVGLLGLIAVWAIVATAQTASVSLTDPKWNLIEVNGVAVTDSKAYLRFDTVKKNTYYGNSSCNFIGGRYKVDDTNLNFSQAIITRGPCQSPEEAKIDKEFLKVFHHTTRFWIYEDTLRLYNGDQVTLIFKASPGKAN
jgi:heat shock protein HslJ